ncbi:TatD family hydrolase [Parafrigoribacterium humi]|uniref:TatD family hydrolase n=1 Tax=Parafrigoribacterium humi TaxID=3144664 RepID=UPI0032EE1096
MSALPPLDVHAHIDASVSKRELEDLGAVVFIATRSISDYELVKDRDDLVSVWGVGCHPSLVGVQKAFDSAAFRLAAKGTPFISEVGLDGTSRVAISKQEEVLRDVLAISDDLGRIVSLHSFEATANLVALLDGRPLKSGHILHWWLGDRASTRKAIELGCYFSVNASMARNTEVLNDLPLDRILFETDHPSGDRFSSKPRLPGRVQDVERTLARHYGITERQVRDQAWRNFAKLVESTCTLGLMPEPVKKMLLSVKRT